MTSKRETFFRCTFSSARGEQTAHVTAWDAKEALQLFEVELRGDGVAERGTIVVTTPAGVTRRASYRPGPTVVHAAGV